MLLPDLDTPLLLHDRATLGLSADTEPGDLIAFDNVVLNIRTMTPHPSALGGAVFGIHHIPINMYADMGPPVRTLKFLSELWPDPQDADQIDTLQEWFGYCLTADTSQHKLLSLIGPPRSGKGTIARVLTAMIGEKNVASPTLSSLAGPFGMAQLIGKRLAVIGDARLSGRADQAAITEAILGVTGEDRQTINRKYLDPISTTLPTRLMLVSNELFRLADASVAVVGRIIALMIVESFVGRENTKLTAQLLAELPQIIMWAAHGLRRLTARGHFVQPQRSRELLDELADLASPVSAFVRDRCVVEDGASVPKPDLFGQWRAWCEEHNRTKYVGTVETFGRDIRAACPRITDRRERVQVGGQAQRLRVWHGIGIAADQGAPQYLTEGGPSVDV